MSEDRAPGGQESRRGGCWPTADQTLLLGAALGEGDEALAAFRTWRSRTAIDRLDFGSARLLPLLFLNLRAMGVDDPLLPALEERYERTAALNERRLATLGAAIARLRAAGIDTLVLKGMALVVRGYVPAGARPMNDLDLLVPETHALAARDLLVDAGWVLRAPMNHDALSVRHGADFTNPSGDRVDLHWHVFAECCAPGADADLWQAAEPALVNGVTTCVLCPADFLLHVSTHGLRWSTVPPVRWAADAMATLRSAGTRLDWDRLIDQATRRSLVLPAIDALRYLREALGAPVPVAVTNQLSRVAVHRRIVAEHRVRMEPRSRARQARYHWLHHRRLSNGSIVTDLMGFPDYLRRFWGVPSYQALARHVVGRLGRKGVPPSPPFLNAPEAPDGE